MNDSPNEFFENCYVKPLAALKGLAGGSGAMIAMGTALFLYERYWSILQPTQREQTRSKQIAKDFAVAEAAADEFWRIFRNGLLHLGSPFQRERGKALALYSMRPDATEIISFDKPGGMQRLVVNPWLFVERVIQMWKARIGDFDSNPSAPIPQRYEIETVCYTSAPDHVEFVVKERN